MTWRLNTNHKGATQLYILSLNLKIDLRSPHLESQDQSKIHIINNNIILPYQTWLAPYNNTGRMQWGEKSMANPWP